MATFIHDTEYWQAFKIATDLQSEPSTLQAQIIREAALTTNTTLISRGQALQAARDAAHRARTPTVDRAPRTPLSAAAQTPVTQTVGRAAETETELANEGRPDLTPDESRGAVLSPVTPGVALPNRSTNAHNAREILGTMRDSTMISTHEINVIVDQMHLRTGTPSAATPPTQSVPVVQSKLERLRELRELLDSEVITQSEYDEGRTHIIRS